MFIYVMDTESRDTLLDLGYELLKTNGAETVWVFKNKPEQQFESLEVLYVLSDVLTF